MIYKYSPNMLNNLAANNEDEAKKIQDLYDDDFEPQARNIRGV